MPETLENPSHPDPSSEGPTVALTVLPQDGALNLCWDIQHIPEAATLAATMYITNTITGDVTTLKKTLMELYGSEDELNGPNAKNNHVLSGLTNGVEYDILLLLGGSANESAISKQVSASGIPSGVPALPEILEYIYKSNGSVDVKVKLGSANGSPVNKVRFINFRSGAANNMVDKDIDDAVDSEDSGDESKEDENTKTFNLPLSFFDTQSGTNNYISVSAFNSAGESLASHTFPVWLYSTPSNPVITEVKSNLDSAISLKFTQEPATLGSRIEKFVVSFNDDTNGKKCFFNMEYSKSTKFYTESITNYNETSATMTEAWAVNATADAQVNKPVSNGIRYSGFKVFTVYTDVNGDKKSIKSIGTFSAVPAVLPLMNKDVSIDIDEWTPMVNLSSIVSNSNKLTNFGSILFDIESRKNGSVIDTKNDDPSSTYTLYTNRNFFNEGDVLEIKIRAKVNVNSLQLAASSGMLPAMLMSESVSLTYKFAISPEPVTGLKVVPFLKNGNAAFMLSWIAPVNSGSSDIVKYNIWKGDSPNDMDVLTGPTGPVELYVVDNLDINKNYWFAVAAVNDDGKESSKTMSGPVSYYVNFKQITSVSANVSQYVDENGMIPIVVSILDTGDHDNSLTPQRIMVYKVDKSGNRYPIVDLTYKTNEEKKVSTTIAQGNHEEWYVEAEIEGKDSNGLPLKGPTKSSSVIYTYLKPTLQSVSAIYTEADEANSKQSKTVITAILNNVIDNISNIKSNFIGFVKTIDNQIMQIDNEIINVVKSDSITTMTIEMTGVKISQPNGILLVIPLQHSVISYNTL